MYRILSGLLLAGLFFCVVQTPARADDDSKRDHMQKKIEDLRKVKILDLLDLQGDQVEKFFAVYNRHQKVHEGLRKEIDVKSKELQRILERDEKSAEYGAKVEELRKLMRDLGKEIESRFDDAKSVLTAKQYAQYVVFEARFRDELQRMIIDRVRQGRK